MYVISCLHLLHNIFTNLSLLWILLYKYFSSWEILRNYSTIFRSSHQRCSIKKAILKNFVILTGKHLCRGLFFNNAAGHQSCTFIKKRLQQKFRVKSDKKQNIFLHNSFKISENFDIKHLRWSKTDLSKETKKLF